MIIIHLFSNICMFMVFFYSIIKTWKIIPPFTQFMCLSVCISNFTWNKSSSMQKRFILHIDLASTTFMSFCRSQFVCNCFVTSLNAQMQFYHIIYNVSIELSFSPFVTHRWWISNNSLTNSMQIQLLDHFCWWQSLSNFQIFVFVYLCLLSHKTVV